MTTSNPVRTTIRPSVHAIQEALFDQLASYGVQEYPHGTGRPADRGVADQAHTHARQAAAAGTLSWRQLVMADMAHFLRSRGTNWRDAPNRCPSLRSPAGAACWRWPMPLAG